MRKDKNNVSHLLLLIFGLFIVIVFIALAGCLGPGTSNNDTSGTVTISISNATNFFGHNIWLQLFNNNTTDENGNPISVKLGWGVISIDADGSGSGIIRDPINGGNLILTPGTYYLLCVADMNNNIPSDGSAIIKDSGDKYTNLLTVTVNKNTTKQITEADFIHTQ